MKKALMFLTIAILSSCSFAAKPPKAVLDSFSKKFPSATKVSWGKEAKLEWEAEFTFEGNKISANFAQDGAWLETESEIKSTELPKAVLASINKTYPGWKIAEADKTETSKHGLIYEADLKNGMKSKSLAYKEDGTAVVE